MYRILFQFLFLFPMMFLIFPSFLWADNFLPGEIWRDNNGFHINAHGGGLLLNEGIYYWYGEHKTEGTGGNVANVGVHCYSSRDLYNWHDEGIVLKTEPENSGSDIQKGCILERPKVLYNQKTNRYVMWFHLELKQNAGYTSARSGVAVSERPTGPFTFLKSVRANQGYFPCNYLEEYQKAPVPEKAKQKFSGGSLPDGETPESLNLVKRDFETGQMARDMTLFQDDNGKGYHIYSSEENSTLHIAELSDDYLSYTGRYLRIFSGRFMEAPAMFKKDNRYYLIMSGCTGWNPNAGRSAVADSIWGEWKELKNPFIGEHSGVSFRSQSTFVLPFSHNGKLTYIYMGDRWTPQNAIDGRYIWLPMRFEGEQPIIEWKQEWKY